MKYDILVIGSGLGGLECAALLGRTGRRVLVLERGMQPGGCMQSYRRNGFNYDTGMHYVGGLGEGETLHEAFKQLNLLDLPWVRMDERFDRVTIEGQTYSLAQGFDNFVSTLSADFPQEQKSLQRFAMLLQRCNEAQWGALRGNADDRTFNEQLWEKSALKYLEETFSTPRLIDVLLAPAMKVEAHCETLPLFTFAHGHSSYIESSWRLKGDGQQIVERLISLIRAQGGDVACHNEVKQLVVDNGKATAALCSNGQSFEADCFVSDVHPAVTLSWIAPDVKVPRLHIFRQRIGAMENTCGAVTVSLRLKANTLPYFGWNQYIDGMMISCRIPESGAYARQIDLLQPADWADWQQWQSTRVGHRDHEYRMKKAQLAASCIAKAERVFPNLSQMIEECYGSTPLTYRDYTFTPQGSAFGVRKDYRQPLLSMLSPRTPISNLLLTGQSLMLSGVHGVTMTAFLTCNEIINEKTI